MAYCLYYATITKHSNLHWIDRLQFPWLTSSIVQWIRLCLPSSIHRFESQHTILAVSIYRSNFWHFTVKRTKINKEAEFGPYHILNYFLLIVSSFFGLKFVISLSPRVDWTTETRVHRYLDLYEAHVTLQWRLRRRRRLWRWWWCNQTQWKAKISFKSVSRLRLTFDQKDLPKAS